jgi:hypothetical protein
VTDRPSAEELLATPGAVVVREDLRSVGLSDYEVDRLMRACGVVVFPGVRRSFVDAEAARAWIEGHR